MDFAKKQLEKYGWQEGKGLGKNENGINIALKPKLKFDNAGIGHDSSEQFTNNWWENLYNSASSNVNINTTANGNVQVNVNDPDGVEITTKNYSLKNLKKKNSGLEYGTFIKTSKLTEGGIVEFDNNNYCDAESSTSKPNLCPLTDEELFSACGGRTAHKGARHGLTLNGKLSRLEKQEKLLLKKLRRVSLSDEPDNKNNRKILEKKLKKIDDHKEKHKTEGMEEDISAIPSGSQCTLSFSSPHKSKKRKKERKRVSFSETVTEYQTQNSNSNTTENQVHDLDSSSQSDGSSRPSTPITTVRQVKIKDVKENSVNNANLLVPDQDEGIDCSYFDSFKEKEASDLQTKIKEDNEKMKRKLKKLRRKCTHSQSELPDLSKEIFKIEDDSNILISKECTKCIKRKIDLDQEDCENLKIKKCNYKFAEEELEPYSKVKSSTLTKKELKRQKKKKRRLEKRINRVADSLNQICKISDIESE